MFNRVPWAAQEGIPVRHGLVRLGLKKASDPTARMSINVATGGHIVQRRRKARGRRNYLPAVLV